MVGCSVRRDRIRPSPLCREKSVAWDLKVGSDGSDKVWMVTSPNPLWFQSVGSWSMDIHGSMRAEVSFPSTVLLLDGPTSTRQKVVKKTTENESCLPKPGMKHPKQVDILQIFMAMGIPIFYRLPLSCPGALWHRLPRWRRNTIDSARHEDHEAPAVSSWWRLTFIKAIMVFPPMGSWHGPTTEYHEICLDCLEFRWTKKTHKADWNESTLERVSL